jgi:hypothetical protein
MNRAITAIVVILFCTLFAGCSDNSADDRVRQFLGIPKSEVLTEEIVADKILALVPAGTAEQSIAKKAQEMGIGKDGLSSYHFIKERNLAVIRIEFDVRTFGVTKSQWIIGFQLDEAGRMKQSSAKRYIAGL